MLVGKTERRAKAICTMINRSLKDLKIEAILVIDPYQSTISVRHTYANQACIDISKPEYTFPISMLDI